MTRNNYIFFFTISFFASTFGAVAQDIGDYTKQEIKELSQKVDDQIRFLEYFLNTLGSDETSARDKDVIIRESYKKIFRDDKVQVEDDLLLDRKVITNKDVTAYLKDIEFFFKEADFKFKVREVKPFLRDNGELSFVVSMDRTITATGLNKEKIANTKPRFVEINLDKKTSELKIASIYTTKLSRDEELAEWWNSISIEWATYFRDKFGFLEDTLTPDQLYKISALDSINISGNQIILNLDPIEVLRDLKYMDISNTQIVELNPISNVTFLTHLNIANTPTQDIQFIKYSDRLTHLDISGTNIQDISELGNLKLLHTLKVVKTPVMSFEVLNSFTALKSLNLSESGFNNLENVQALNGLQYLDISKNYLINFDLLSKLEALEEINLNETNISDISSLTGLNNLKVVYISQTEVGDLFPLNGKTMLQRIYADRTGISEDNANAFSRKNRRVLLIHHVENLETWWNELPDSWKEVFITKNPTINRVKPSVEDLSSLVGVDSLDLSNSQITALGPILKFKKINYISFDNTAVQDLSPLSEMNTLTSISGINTQVKSLQPLVNLQGLTELNFESSPISSIEMLSELKSLEYLNVDSSEISIAEIPVFLQKKPEINIIFRTEALNNWWLLLDNTWKKIFRDQLDIENDPNTQMLHKLAASPELKVEKVSISNLQPLLVFINLRKLAIFDVPLMDASAISEMVLLEELKISQAPLSDLTVFAPLDNLVSLDISNTGIEDLRPIGVLTKLEVLNISGTNVKVLRGLESLNFLIDLDIASTNVRSLRPVQGLSNLRKLACFNTRVNSRAVDSFKRANPDCEVRYY